MDNLSEHFKASEFQCHDGGPLPGDFHKTIKDTVEFLERLRGFMNFYVCKQTGVWLDLGIHPTSGYRSKEYMKRKNIKDSGNHSGGFAADIEPVGGYKYFSYSDFYKMAVLVDRSYKSRPYRIGYYGKSKFVHVDCRYGHGGRRWTGN